MHRPAALLIDLDGVLYVEDEPIPGAVEAVKALRGLDLPIRYVTNTTTRPRAAIVARLRRLGFDCGDDELVTPARLAVRHCLDRGHERVALVMADAVKADLAALKETDSGVQAVVVGDLGSGFGYDVLNRAFRHLMDGAELVALQKNRFWRTPGGLALDVGPFVAALEYAAGTEAVVVGKPSPDFFATVLAELGVPAHRAAIVGDDVESDVGGGRRAGLTGILVRTGKYRADVVERSGVCPDATIDSIAGLPALLAADAAPER